MVLSECWYRDYVFFCFCFLVDIDTLGVRLVVCYWFSHESKRQVQHVVTGRINPHILLEYTAF